MYKVGTVEFEKYNEAIDFVNKLALITREKEFRVEKYDRLIYSVIYSSYYQEK
jgi:hypothetical protein